MNGESSKVVEVINELQASLKDNTTDNKPTVKRQSKCQPFTKSKELQPNTQADIIAAHLLLPNHTTTV